MEFKQITAQEFDDFVEACLATQQERPPVDIFQSSRWGEIAGPMGMGRPVFLAQCDDSGRIRIAGMYYFNSAKFLGGYMYCQHGPVHNLPGKNLEDASPVETTPIDSPPENGLPENDLPALNANNWGEHRVLSGQVSQLITAFLDGVEEFAKTNNQFMVVYEPLATRESQLVKAICSAGYMSYKRSVLPKYPMFIDLSRSEEEMLASLSKSTRYNIKQAGKQGVQIEVIYPDSPNTSRQFTTKYGQSPAEIFYDLLKAVSSKKMYSIPPLSFFQNAWEKYQGSRSIAFVFATYQGKVLSANFSQFYRDWAGSYYTANLPGFSKQKASYLLKWQTILAAKQQSKLVFDMWGYYPGLKPGHPEYGYGEFKKGFHGVEKVFAGWLVKPVSQLKYRLWRLVSEIKSWF